MNRITLITLGLSIAACSSSDPPTREQYDATAQAIAMNTATSGGGGDVASMSDSVTIAQGATLDGFSLSGDGHFQGSRLGLDYSYAITCKNAAGVVGLCSAATTDQATVQVSWSGNLTTPNLQASVTRNGSWSITGLQSDTATFSGDSTLSLDTTVHADSGATASYMFDASASYDAVQIATQDRRVVGGSASFDVTAHAQVTGTGGNNTDKSFEVHAEITFHADHTADLVLDASQHYSLDLTTGLVVRVNQ